MAKKPEQLEEVEVTQEEPVVEVAKPAEKAEDKKVVLMNTLNYTVFVKYLKDECAIPPRGRIQVLESGLPSELPTGIYKL